MAAAADGAVEHPRVAWPYPHDAVRRDTVGQQPDDAVGGGLAGADDDVVGRQGFQPGEVSDRDDVGVVGNDERGRRRRGNRRREVGGVDHAPAHVDLHRLAGHPRRHDVRGAVGVVLAGPEEGDAARAEELPVQDVVVVRQDLRLACPFVEPGFRTPLLHRAGSELRRRDAVEQRRLVELHEGIGVEPMTTGRVATIDERDVHIRVIDERVGERHPHRTGPHDEVVRLRCCRHGYPLVEPPIPNI